VRTTVHLSEELLAQAKKKALRDGTTFTALVERGLRLVLDSPKSAQASRRMPRISSVSGRQLVDTVKTGELLDGLDEQLPIEKRR
jgi:hypothetical protein